MAGVQWTAVFLGDVVQHSVQAVFNASVAEYQVGGVVRAERLRTVRSATMRTALPNGGQERAHLR